MSLPAANPFDDASPQAAFDRGGVRSAVVVAHPDDEVLWLSSALSEAERIVFCFGDPLGKPHKAAARRGAVAALRSPRLVDLAIPESGAGFSIDWRTARLTASGIEIDSAERSARYEANFATLLAALRAPLAGMTDVYTHNPWGEYGHAEHIQVHCAIATLQREFGYRIWFSNYVGPVSWSLAARLAPTLRCQARRSVYPDRRTAKALRAVYQAHGAWTWSRWHRWPDEEQLFGVWPQQDVGDSLQGAHLIDVAALRPWRRIRKAAVRTLPGS